MFWPLLSLLVVVVGWYAFEAWWDRRLFKAAPGQICANLNGAEARAFLRDHPETQVLDVRSTVEFSGGAVPKAENISLGDPDFDQKLQRLDRSKPVLVYCAGGFRSRKALVRLKELGFANIQHLHRGYMSWSSSGPQ